MAEYMPTRYDGDVVLLRCIEREPFDYDATPLWTSICPKFAIYEIPGNHRSAIREPAVDALADAISRVLQAPSSRHSRVHSASLSDSSSPVYRSLRTPPLP